MTYWKENDSPAWAWWRDWYLGMWDGTFDDWDFCEQVAMIDNDVWDAGPEAVGEAIRQLQLKDISAANAGDVQFGTPNKLDYIPATLSTAPLLGTLLSRLEDTVEDIGADLANELPPHCHPMRIVTRSFQKYANDPQRLEMDFTDVQMILFEGIADNTYPATSPVKGLMRQLDDTVNVLRDEHTKIRENRDRLNRLRIANLTPKTITTALETLEVLAEKSDPTLLNIIHEGNAALGSAATDIGIQNNAPTLPGAARNPALSAEHVSAIQRVASISAKVVIYLKGFDRAELSRLLKTPEAQLAAFIATLVSVAIGLVTF